MQTLTENRRLAVLCANKAEAQGSHRFLYVQKYPCPVPGDQSGRRSSATSGEFRFRRPVFGWSSYMGSLLAFRTGTTTDAQMCDT